MKIDELIERIRPKSRKELPFFLLKAGVTILVVSEFLYDISHVRFSEEGMVWLLLYITKVLVFGVVLYILYRKVKKWKKNDRWLAGYVFLFSIVFVAPFMNGSIFGMLFVDGLYWGKVIDADTGKPIAGASVAKYMEFETCEVFLKGSYYGDVRETVTDENGCFFLPVNRRIFLWPLTRAHSSLGLVYKPGYYSSASRVYDIWNNEDKEKWLHKLNRQYPEYRKEYSKKYYAQKYKRYPYEIDPKEYFSNPKYAPYIYCRLFGVHWKRFKTNIIKLNKAETDRMRNQVREDVVRLMSFYGDFDIGDEYKVKRLKDLVMRERRKYGLKTY